MTESNYVKLYSGNFMLVQRMVDKLEAIGINPIIKDETESGRLAGFPASIMGQQDLYVNLDELEKARQIVDDVKSEMEA